MIDPTINQYQNGKIYKLISAQTDDIYIGSTKNLLSERFERHKSNFKNKCKYISSDEILKYEDAKIELIENYSTTSKFFLEVRETELIEELKCVNRILPRNKNKYQYDENRKLIDPTIDEYKQGKIYKLISKQTDNIYIGSTKQKLSNRFNNHKSNYRMGLKYSTAIEILQYDDVEN